MIDRFLKAKHWQLFILMFGIPIISQFVMMGAFMLSNMGTQRNTYSIQMPNMIWIFPLIMLVFMGLFFGWFWSIAIGLQKKVPENIKMKTKKFKIFFFIPIIYITLFSFLIGSVFNGMTHNGVDPNGDIIAGIAGVIVPLHLLSMFGIFYSMYFAAKTFKTVELQKEVSFGDFAGEFFMLWFYPIGVWIVQPKINKMIKKEETADTLYEL